MARVVSGLILVHLFFAFRKCFIYPQSRSMQKEILGSHFESTEALQVSKLVLFNIGAYDFLTSALVLISLYNNEFSVMNSAMLVFACNSAVLYLCLPNSWIESACRFTSAILAIISSQGLNKSNNPIEITSFGPILVPAVLHVLFFLAESVLFSRVKSIQRLFLGRQASSAIVVEVGTKLMFLQGIYNLLLSLVTFHGLLTGSLSELGGTLFCYVGAACALLYSSPRMYKGFLIQGLPALYALTIVMKKPCLEMMAGLVSSFDFDEDGDELHDHQ
jgi:putative membrane protein